MVNYAIPEVSYVLFGIESSYPDATSDSEPATVCSSFFWAQQTFSDANKNNLQKIYSIAGGRDIQSLVNGRFESTITIESLVTDLQSPWQLIAGAISGSGPYTATLTNYIPSFAVEIGYKDYLGNMKRVKFFGCKINSAAITGDKSGEPVKVSLEIYAQRFFINDTLQTPTAPTTAPYVGYESTMEIPTSTTLIGLQNWTFTIGQNLFRQQDTSSRLDINLVERKRDYTLALTYFANSNTGISLLSDFMGSSSLVSRLATPTSTSGRLLLYRSAANQTIVTFPSSSLYYEDHTMPLDIGGDLSIVTLNTIATSVTSIAITNS